MAQESGCPSRELVEGAAAGYFEMAYTREMLDSRYDDLERGRVKPIDGAAFFESMRSGGDEL